MREPPSPPSRRRRVVDPTVTLRACLTWRECPCGKPAATGHHVLAKSSPHFGDDVLENIVPACGSGTTGCHGRWENEDERALRQLGRHIRRRRPDVIGYVLWKLGETPGRDWLRRRLSVKLADVTQVLYCPYCGTPRQANTPTCALHRDLPALEGLE